MGSKNVRKVAKKKSLNIIEHRNRLVKMALKRYDTKKEAAEALGITPRHLLNLEQIFKSEEKDAK